MFQRYRTPLLVALTILCVASTVALAAEGVLSGTVQNVDPRQGRLTVRTGEDSVVELRAPAELLTGLQTGDAVDVRRSGQQATLIHRHEGVQQPELSGALRLQPPREQPPVPEAVP
jgi:hypothetical protein